MAKPNTAENRLGPDLTLAAKAQPPSYSGPRQGQGAWVTLWSHGDQLGYLWATDTGLGFVPSSDKGVGRVPEFYQAFSHAKTAGTKPMDVFDAWAAKTGQGLYAGEVGRGDVATLPA